LQIRTPASSPGLLSEMQEFFKCYSMHISWEHCLLLSGCCHSCC